MFKSLVCHRQQGANGKGSIFPPPNNHVTVKWWGQPLHAQNFGACSPTPPPTGLALLYCLGEQSLLYQALWLVKERVQLPCQLQVVVARGEGIFPSTPPSNCRHGRWDQLSHSYALRTSSAAPLSTRSTLLSYPCKAQDPFSQVLQLVKSWVKSQTCCSCQGVKRGGPLSLTHTTT